MILTRSVIQLTKEAEKRKSSANIAISSINFWLIQHTESCDKVDGVINRYVLHDIAGAKSTLALIGQQTSKQVQMKSKLRISYRFIFSNNVKYFPICFVEERL